MMARLNREKSELMTIILSNPECRWLKKTKDTMKKYDIQERELEGKSGKPKNSSDVRSMNMSLRNSRRHQKEKQNWNITTIIRAHGNQEWHWNT